MALVSREILPKYGYTDEQINQVKELIYATIIPHDPKNKLEQIICDADLDYLGRDDFFEISETLRRELRDHGKKKVTVFWMKFKLNFNSTQVLCKSAKKREKLKS